VHPALPVRNVRELIALARAHPGQLNFASSGTGGLIHLTGELFKQMAKIDIVHVPYKGTALFLPDLLNGQIAMSLDTLPPHLPFIKTGKLRALAVTTVKRSPVLPDLPTVAEAALPGFESVAIYALLAPAGTSKDIVTSLNRETNVVLQMGDVKDKLSAQGIEPLGGTPEAVSAIIRNEVAKWARVIKEGGITPE
jgi:tripartite-type tricarboxylate transporter receptor subunit TctC